MRTKEHLDAYLASADVVIEQRDEPGNFYLSWAASLYALWIGS
jgi:hypothetical protein